ncbi:LysR family transcriptional regulator [Stenotrophomonas sp. PD6]|uniref:LysR family transcriptional regulator n=1 Tax=Stenotrophomonas sp. PD6 TaxID=3368612 RepID=UPI003B9EBCA0
MSNIEWSHHQAFMAVMAAGSLSAAARSMGTAQATVRRRIDALEQSLGVELFNRSATALIPTEAAQGLARHVQAMAFAVDAMARDASGRTQLELGAVRIGASELLGCELLVPALQGLADACPGVRCELSLTDRVEALLLQEVDIALRTLRPVEPDVVARRVGRSHVGLHASRDYLARYGVPASLQQVQEWVGPDRNAGNLHTLQQHGMTTPAEQMRFRSDAHLGQLAAIRSGLGVGPCHRVIARRYDLVPVLEDAFGFTLDVWLAMPRSLRRVRRARSVFDHLAGQLDAALR